MIQTHLVNLSFLKEYCFELTPSVFKLKAGPLFGRSFGDQEHIPLSFQVNLNEQEVELKKIDMNNQGGQIVLTYQDEKAQYTFFIYL